MYVILLIIHGKKCFVELIEILMENKRFRILGKSIRLFLIKATRILVEFNQKFSRLN